MATAVRNPTDASVWQDGRVDPLSWRWHGPALGIAIAMALATAIVSLSDGLEVRDTDKMLSPRILLVLGTFAFFIVLDLVPRAIRHPGPIHRALPAVSAPSRSGSSPSTSPTFPTATSRASSPS